MPKFDPFISGLQHTYRYHDYIQLNCSSEGSNPPATLTWYINNKTATMKAVKPQINEISRTTDGFALYASNLQLLINIDDSRFITKSEVLELKCVADIMGIPSVRRETKVRATILALADISYKQRLESPNSAAHSIHCNRVQLAMWTSKWSVWRLIYALMMMTLANLWPTGCNYRMS
uniref:Ig-like domain-containing protein n=1 Tax=Stomoxys calcitrans TaxID=35570 RepID=A0A1I8P164_STOCA